MDKFIGTKLRKARESIGLSQTTFARAVGLSPEYISVLEASKRVPSFSTLQKIAAYLNRDIAFFFYEKPAPLDSFTLLFRAEAVDDRAREELQKFRRYCDDYLRLEAITGRHLELAPLYAPSIAPERAADEERRRLGLGDEPVRDIFALLEANGCRILRMPMPEDSKVSGVFIYLEQKEAAFALVNSAQAVGRQAFSAVHEYCHYLKDRNEGPVIDNPDVFVDEYVALYHPREVYAQTFAARFLMPPDKVREIIAKDLRVNTPQRLVFDQVIYLKRYFGVSTLAMLRTLRSLGYIGRTQLDDYVKLDPDVREKEIFGSVGGGNGGPDVGGKVEGLLAKMKKRILPSDRFKLLHREAARRVAAEKKSRKPIQKTLPEA
jgi:transcriptional regulator with XRE-family HTH domain